ncbi:hypothetical protein [Bradyrhizobium sp. USDA 3364]
MSFRAQNCGGGEPRHDGRLLDKLSVRPSRQATQVDGGARRGADRRDGRQQFIRAHLKPSIGIGVNLSSSRDIAAVASERRGERYHYDQETSDPAQAMQHGFSRRCVAVSRLITSGSRRTIRRLRRDESAVSFSLPFSLPGRNAATHNRGNDQDGLLARCLRSAMSGGK